MRLQRAKRASFQAIFVLAALVDAAPVDAQAIWFSPQSRLEAGSDYLDLFRPDAPWKEAASHVEVFELSGHAILGPPAPPAMSDADLSRIFADLKSRHIGLLIGTEPLGRIGPVDSTKGPIGPLGCGYHVESYGGPPPLAVAQRAKALGAEPSYFGFDEPLYFGHVYSEGDGIHGCHEPIAEIARRVADVVRQVRAVFPGVKFGDVEPLTFQPEAVWFRDDQWLADLSAWFDAYEAAVGEKLAFFRVDMWWTERYLFYMQSLFDLLARKGVPLQIIYNGDGGDQTDATWIAHAISHFKEFESGPWPNPSAVVFQYWTKNPTRVLPETDPLTATGLIDRYLQWRQTGR